MKKIILFASFMFALQGISFGQTDPSTKKTRTETNQTQTTKDGKMKSKKSTKKTTTTQSGSDTTTHMRSDSMHH
jgi:hypothetical protein